MAGKAKKIKKEKTDFFEVVFNTADWLIMAFAVTLVFIVFVMQAYTIPTGSMADTLRGAHFRLRCRQCGYRYDHGFRPEMYGYKTAVTPGKRFLVEPPMRAGTSDPKCPSCGYYMAPVKVTRRGDQIHYEASADRLAVPSKGDRIFVLKCIYQFMDPKRWDVIVFKDPLKPKINYIKRLIGLPGESIELIDGDVYADGLIARKPANVQEELWMCVYDNDYVPIDPSADYSVAGAKRFNGNRWQQPFVNAEGSQWDMSGNGGRVFKLASEVSEENTIVYDTTVGNDFRATYAYDASRWYSAMPICSDVMVRFSVARTDSHADVGVEISKYGVKYRGWIDDHDQMVIGKVDAAGSVVELAKQKSDWVIYEGLAHDFRFAVVDHELVLKFDDYEIRYDLGRGADDLGERNHEMPVVSISGSGKMELSHVGIFRDMYYTPVVEGGSRIVRADEGDPFRLEEGEYFVCGDNSPASFDSRLWNEPGKGNNGNDYRMGIVPQDYLIGKAFFVYWPGGFQPWFEKGFRLVPHVGGVKLIAGGE